MYVRAGRRINSMVRTVQNIIIAGLGGQGVLKSSDILADAAFRAGKDVKKAEVHGMSQRGGSVTSDVRIGRDILSPMVPTGEADFLVVLSDDQIDNNRHLLRPDGMLIIPSMIDTKQLKNPRSINVALLGRLSRCLDIDESYWLKAIETNLPEKLVDANIQAFRIGRENGT